MLSNKKAIIFDLDGTLFDSMLVWRDIDIEFLNEYGFVVDYPALQKDIEGCSMYETALYFINRFHLTESAEELIDIWNKKAVDKYTNEILPKPFAIDFINKLYENSYKLAVGSSNSRYLIEAVLEAHDILDKIDVIVTSDEVKKGKPEPDVYLMAAEKLGESPSDCIVFEDLLAGIEAGSRAGMSTCAIWDFYSKNDWDEKILKADYHINDYSEVINLIHERN